MASSALSRFPTYHDRSISLPSRPHPVILNAEEHTNKLASSNDGVTPSSSSQLSSKLSDLRQLYDSIDALLELPHTRWQLAHESQKGRVDGLLSSSVCFLDACGVAKDALLQTKDQLQDLQSVLRRKKGDEPELIKGPAKYLASRKMSKKSISKSLRNFKNTCSNLPLSKSGINFETPLGKLKKVEMISANLLASMLSFLSGPRVENRWFLASKLMSSSDCASCSNEEPTKYNEFDNVDSMLQAMINHRTRKSVGFDKDGVQKELRKLELIIQDLEEELDSVVRRIIRVRASLLNTVTG